MAWTDNITEAAYNSPTGVRVPFGFEDVTYNVDKKTSGHTFPDADGTYVQDWGHAGRQYPIRAFLWGDDYDEQAATLDAALLERGMGKLEHPIYGTVNVVPYGTITRRDDLTTAANQAVIEVTFWETTDLLYPSAQIDPASAVAEAVEEFTGTFALQGIDTTFKLSELQANTTRLLEVVRDPMAAVAEVTDKVNEKFNEIVDSLEKNLIDPVFMRAVALGAEIEEKFTNLAGEIEENVLAPVILVRQVLAMLQSPARADSDDRIEVYETLLDEILSEPTPETIEVDQVAPDASSYVPRELYAMGLVTGTVVSLINTQFSTRVQAIEAADRLITQFSALTAWRDDNHVGVDTGESYQKLQEAIALTAGFLVEISFTLKTERRVVLDRARTIIDLAAELHGSVDDMLDFLIQSNDLTGDEIMELPRGREIVYYI